nr:hypothetical protein [Tanacetum cinerariifolium]
MGVELAMRADEDFKLGKKWINEGVESSEQDEGHKKESQKWNDWIKEILEDAEMVKQREETEFLGILEEASSGQYNSEVEAMSVGPNPAQRANPNPL